MITPIVNIPIREGIIKDMEGQTDRQIADKIFSAPFIDPEYYSELMDRGLSGPGVSIEETYRRINEREKTKP